MRIGVLAEDLTDCETVDVLVKRIAAELTLSGVGTSPFWGKGCARLRAKARPKLHDMAREGCLGAVLLHDLDRDGRTNALNDKVALEADLQAIECPNALPRLICIPVEELEAWFWSDERVVQKVGRGKGKASPSPHLLIKPKERLRALSIAANGKPRYDTNENKELAAMLDMTVCARACPSFAQFRDFVRHLLTAPIPNGTAGRTAA